LHTPGWVGYPGARIYYTQTLQTNRIVSQRIETSLHTGTHLDGPMHGTDGGLDIASLPLEKLVHQGVVVDVSVGTVSNTSVPKISAEPRYARTGVRRRSIGRAPVSGVKRTAYRDCGTNSGAASTSPREISSTSTPGMLAATRIPPSTRSRRSPTTGRERPLTEEAPIADEVRAWAEKPHARAWLRLDPPLGEIDLRPYFTYSRDKLTFGVAVTRLPPHLQEMLTKVQAEVDSVRRLACDAIAQLPDGERVQLVEALVDTVTRRPGGPGFVAALELAERAPDTLLAVCDALKRIPPQAIPIGRAGIAVLRREVGGYGA